jgi:hypothetical protein
MIILEKVFQTTRKAAPFPKTSIIRATSSRGPGKKAGRKKVDTTIQRSRNMRRVIRPGKIPGLIRFNLMNASLAEEQGVFFF